MSSLKVLCLLLSVVIVKGSPFFSNFENDLSNLHEHNDEKQEEPDVHRLSDEIVPISYELRFVPDLETFNFAGRAEIHVHVKFTTNQIILHSSNLDIKSVRVTKTYLLDCKFTLDKEHDLLIIEVSQPLMYNTEYTITIEFEGKLNDDMKGLYRSSHKAADGKDYWLAATQFEPTYAREAFPCFDEPRFRARFTIYIARKNGQLAISNMPSEAQLPPDSMSGNRIWEKFQQSPPMATYLVAFMLADQFSFIPNTNEKIHVYARKDGTQQTIYASKQASKLLTQLEGYTGIQLKVPKLDVVAIPDFKAGAMENWGMTTFRERYVLLDEQTSAEQHKTGVTEVISHEFAHQWFGDLVTPAWWDYLWLNEGFATYFENFAAATVEPSWNLDELFVVETVQHALWNEITVQRAMTSKVQKFSQIKQAFDVISYDKAGSVIRMFEHIVSPPVFKSALHYYLNDVEKNHGGTVTQQHLFDAFDTAISYGSATTPAHVSMSEIMRSWTETPGYPLITISRCYHHGEVTIKQTGYLSIRTHKPLPDRKWIVPLTYTTKSNPKFSNTQPTHWSFADKPTELPGRFSNSDWVLFNLQHSGYYRVNYDLKNWHLLIDQLHEDPKKIHVLNRAQLIDDSSALAHDEILNFYIHLHLLQYLSKEDDMIAWYSAITSLNRLRTETEGTSNYAFIRDYIENLLKIPLEKFGFDIKTTDSHVTKIVKPMILSMACHIGIESCIQSSLAEYKKNEANLEKVQPDLKKVVYCNTLRNSKDQEAVFNNLWNTYKKTDISYNKNEILMTLSCITDEEVIKKILKKFTDPKNNEIRKQDIRYVTATFSHQIPTVTAILKFAIQEIPTMSQATESGILSVETLIESIKGSIKTPEQIQLIKELEAKTSTLDQKKHSGFISTVKNWHVSASKKLEKRNKASERIKDEYLSPDKKPPSDKPTEKPPQPGSGATALIPKLWWHLAVISTVLCYGASVLRTL